MDGGRTEKFFETYKPKANQRRKGQDYDRIFPLSCTQIITVFILFFGQKAPSQKKSRELKFFAAKATSQRAKSKKDAKCFSLDVRLKIVLNVIV